MMQKWVLAAGAAMMASAVGAGPAAAQSGLDGRVGKLESEMRAVQRKVFPGGAGATIAPEIAPQPQAVDPAGIPATTPIADLTARVTSLEQQLSTLTGQVEQTQYRMRQLEEQFTAYKTATDAKLASAATPAPLAAAAVATGDTSTAPDTPVPVATPRGTRTETAAAAPTPAAGDAVQKPATGDAGEDEYTYGYRLWAAKRYGEAAAQLKKVVAQYPKHRRASFAQNLLGRTYLDDNKPSLASIAFYDNYKKYPEGERAPESLYYLGSALTKLDKPADACKVYGELLDVYGDKISPAMKTSVARARTSAKCQ